MGQAQTLLEEANKQAELHAAMQCKQRDEQKAIIIKHEVKDTFFLLILASALCDSNKNVCVRSSSSCSLSDCSSKSFDSI